MSKETRRKSFRRMIVNWESVGEAAVRLGTSRRDVAKRVAEMLPWEIIDIDAGGDIPSAQRLVRVVNRTAKDLWGSQPPSFPQMQDLA